MSCLLVPPAKRVWRGLSARLGLRRRRTTGAGLGRLRKEVRTCEYSDVHVMWEMLSVPSGSGVRDGRRRATAGKAGAAAGPCQGQGGEEGRHSRCCLEPAGVLLLRDLI